MSVTCSQKEKGSQGNLLPWLAVVYMCTNQTLPFSCQNPHINIATQDFFQHLSVRRTIRQDHQFICCR